MNGGNIFTTNLTNKHELILRFLFFILLLSSCTDTKGNEIIDRSGSSVVIKNPINRVISTAPSNTEIIFDLGQAHKLIAIDRHSANIDGLADNLPLLDFFYPDAEVIINLEPDLIIASGHNTTGSGEDPFRLLREMGIPVAYISMSKSINDIYGDIAFIAELLQVKDRGAELIDSMKTRINEISEKAAHLHTQRSVYIEISAAPEMITFGMDSYINDMISLAGAQNIFGNDMWIVFPSAEVIIERNPDVILTGVDYLDDPIAEIKNRYGFNHISAVVHNRVYRIDSDSLARPSARIIAAMEQMAAAIYPELYE